MDFAGGLHNRMCTDGKIQIISAKSVQLIIQIQGLDFFKFSMSVR